MFTFAQAFLLIGMMIGTDLCFADIENSRAELDSDVDAFLDFTLDRGTRLGEQLQRSQPFEEVKNGSDLKGKVAFFVGLSKSFGPVGQISDVVLDNIVTNVGSGYSTLTGRFVAPVAGTYQFNVNVAAQHANSAAVVLLKNGLTVLTIWSEARPNWAPSSNVAILSLRAGDQVWLQVGHHQWPSYVYGHSFTTFSGFLIFED